MTDDPWLAHYPSGIDWRRDYPERPLDSLLDEAAAHWPDRVAIDFLNTKITYGELKDKADRAAKGLQELGVQKGTRVGLFLPNCPQFVFCYYAILKAGGTVVNYNPLYSPSEVERQVRDSQTEFMVTLNLGSLHPKLAPLAGNSPLKCIIVSDFLNTLPLAKRILFSAFRGKDLIDIPEDGDHCRLGTIMENDGRYKPVKTNVQEDVAVLQYTGGTTGVPKGAALTHRNVHVNALQSADWFHVLKEGQDVMMAALPFFHVFAMTAVMNVSIAKGLRMVVHPRFELIKVLKDIDRKKPTLMPGVPTMFTAINNHKTIHKYDLSSLKMCVSGGAALPVEVKQRFEQLTGAVLVEGYGLTESSPVACANPVEGTNKPGSIGLPLPGTRIEIRDPESRELMPQGEIGEVCIIGPQVMKGYWHRRRDSAEVLIGGRLHTGDLGYLDEEGYVFIVDRLKEMIIAGGYNIYPRHIEEVLYEHEGVLECAVIGVPDEYRGETVKAFIVCKEGHTLDKAALKQFLKPRLAPFQIPTLYEFRDELPKSMIGKILKKELS